MYVVCVRKGDKYGPEYTWAIKKMAREHMGMEAICLGDDLPFIYPFQGWWAKLELFAPEREDLRPCFYLDLDTYLMDDCRDFLFEPDKLWLIRDFYQPQRSNSGLMILPKDTQSIWQAGLRSNHRGDGDFFRTCSHEVLQEYFDGIYSYKAHSRDEPKGRICCFHGKPKPHEAEGWAGEYWQRLIA